MKIKNMGSIITMVVLAAILVVAAGGCEQKSESNDGEQASPEISKPNDPVSLVFFSGTVGTMNEEQFEKYVKEPVSKKYPHISLTFVLHGEGTTIQDLITRGETPDLITNGPASISTYEGLELTTDVTPLAKKHAFDFSRVDQPILDFISAYSNKSGLYAMPFMTGTPVLFYNKDIFDKFGVSYPADGMTYEQIRDLGLQVARKEGDVQYRAVDFFGVAHLSYNQLSVDYINPATNKSNFNSPDWKKLYEKFHLFFEIPGSEFLDNYGNWEELFLKDKITAMLHSPFNNPFTAISSDEELRTSFNWDMATIPVFAESPNLGATPIPNHVMITKTSQHQDDAFRVVETILSDEVQLMLSKGGIVPVLKKQSIKDGFLSDIAFAKDKNIAAVFKLDRAQVRNVHELDGVVQGLQRTIGREFHSGTKDINTALRDAEEAANLAIEAEMAKRK